MPWLPQAPPPMISAGPYNSSSQGYAYAGTSGAVALIWTLPGVAHSVVAVPTLSSPPTLVHWGRVESGSAAATGAATTAAAAQAAARTGVTKRRGVRIGKSLDSDQ